MQILIQHFRPYSKIRKKYTLVLKCSDHCLLGTNHHALASMQYAACWKNKEARIFFTNQSSKLCRFWFNPFGLIPKLEIIYSSSEIFRSLCARRRPPCTAASALAFMLMLLVGKIGKRGRSLLYSHLPNKRIGPNKVPRCTEYFIPLYM